MKPSVGISDIKSEAHGCKKILVKEDGDKAQTLSDLFSSVFTRKATTEIREIEDRLIRKSLTEIEVSENVTTRKKLKTLIIDKAREPDYLHPRILKELQEKMSKVLHILFNESLRDEAIPNDWKTAHVSAIYKKGYKSEANSCRPVTLTCIMCKLLELVVKNQLIHAPHV